MIKNLVVNWLLERAQENTTKVAVVIWLASLFHVTFNPGMTHGIEAVYTALVGLGLAIWNEGIKKQ